MKKGGFYDKKKENSDNSRWADFNSSNWNRCVFWNKKDRNKQYRAGLCLSGFSYESGFSGSKDGRNGRTAGNMGSTEEF